MSENQQLLDKLEKTNISSLLFSAGKKLIAEHPEITKEYFEGKLFSQHEKKIKTAHKRLEELEKELNYSKDPFIEYIRNNITSRKMEIGQDFLGTKSTFENNLKRYGVEEYWKNKKKRQEMINRAKYIIKEHETEKIPNLGVYLREHKINCSLSWISKIPLYERPNLHAKMFVVVNWKNYGKGFNPRRDTYIVIDSTKFSTNSLVAMFYHEIYGHVEHYLEVSNSNEIPLYKKINTDFNIRFKEKRATLSEIKGFLGLTRVDEKYWIYYPFHSAWKESIWYLYELISLENREKANQFLIKHGFDENYVQSMEDFSKYYPGRLLAYSNFWDYYKIWEEIRENNLLVDNTIYDFINSNISYEHGLCGHDL